MSRSSHGRLRFGTRKFRRTIERDDFWCFVAASATRIIISNDSFSLRPPQRVQNGGPFFSTMQLPLVLRECSFFTPNYAGYLLPRWRMFKTDRSRLSPSERTYSMSAYFKVSPIFRVATAKKKTFVSQHFTTPLKVTCLEHVTVERFRNLVGQTRRTSNVGCACVRISSLPDVHDDCYQRNRQLLLSIDPKRKSRDN